MVKIYYMSYNCEGICKNAHRYKEKEYMQRLCKSINKTEKSMYFSKSHSSGYVMIGYATSTIGCDVERIRYEWTIDDIKKRLFFYLNDDDLILSKENPQKAAILAWTRKESYYKVHQNRAIPAEFCISSLENNLTIGDRQFFSIQEGEMILTCYVEKGHSVDWIKIR